MFKNEETIMFYALSWFVVFSFLALWSLAAWVFHAIAAWTVSHASGMTGAAGASEGFRIPDWLAPWVPPDFAAALASMVSAFTPAIEAVLGWAPALQGGLSVAVWAVWGIGSAMLIVLGIVLSALIAVLRQRSSTPTTPSGGQAAG